MTHLASAASLLPAAYWTPLASLHKWLKNPRRNDRAVPRVARSIRRYGFIAPVVVWQSRDRLVAGHTRILAMERLLAEDAGFVPRDAPGVGLVPVRFHEFTDEAEANAYALADNRLNEEAEWDSDVLAEVIAELRGQDATLLIDTGFSDREIRDLLEPARGGSTEADAGDGPAAPEASDALLAKWSCSAGDLWIIEGAHGAHRLLCGDCRRPEDVARLVGNDPINLAFTSPPYADRRRYDESSEFKPIAPDEYVDWFEAVQANVKRHLAPDGSWLVNIRAHSEGGERHLYVTDLLVAHKRRWGWCFIDDLVWVRAGVPGIWPNRFKNAWEPIFQFALSPKIKFRPEAVSVESKHAFKYDPSYAQDSASGSGLLGKEHRAGFEHGMARPSNVLEIGSGGSQVTGSHPAEFPVGLPRWFLLAYSDPGDIAYEPFAGSGTTLLAAEQTGRLGRGMEISPRYCAVILERLAAAGLRVSRGA